MDIGVGNTLNSSQCNLLIKTGLTVDDPLLKTMSVEMYLGLFNVKGRMFTIGRFCVEMKLNDPAFFRSQ